jgi:hypothetical protein
MKTKILLTGILAAGLFIWPPAAVAGGWGGMGGRGFYGGNWGGFHGGFYGGGYGYPWWGWWPPVSVGVAFYPAPYYGSPYYGNYGPSYGGNSYYGNSSSGYAYGTVTQAVQSALARRGYYRGAIDGVLGPETHNAIRSFQAQNGLAVTGQIDSSLIRSLQR